MKPKIVEVDHPLTLLGGARARIDDLTLALALAPTCVAADSGAHLALEAGVDLAAVIGDMDSLSDAARGKIPVDRIHYIAEQDSTDFDKALRTVAAPLVVAVGFTGGQIDHALAALETLVRRCDRAVVLLGRRDVVFLCPRRFLLPMDADTRVSLFPMAAVSGTSQGLYWPIDGIRFAPGQRSGTSNKSTGDIKIEVDAPDMLCILPRRFIQPVVSMLLALPETARWPVRAG
ncbi:MAG: thiamine diphosphokinase [Pseudomonadota bacterium]